VDTYRLSEAFEAGAIPLTEPEMGNEELYGLNIPFPIETVEWDDKTLSLVELLLQNTTLLDEVQARCINWWQQYKQKVSEEFRQAITTNYRDTRDE